MKRIRLLVLAGAVAVALPFGLATAKATGSSGGSSKGSESISIQRNAQYDLKGGIIHVQLTVQCRPGPIAPGAVVSEGLVSVDVSQKPPETPYPVAAGSGMDPVVCDGKPHSVGSTITGLGFDAGKAKAVATLIPAPGSGGKSVKAEKTIYITVMNR